VAREKNIPEPHDPTLGPVINTVHVGGESIVDRLMPHAKKIALALVGAALIVTAVVVYRYYQHKKAERATVTVVHALELVDRQVFNPDPSTPQPPLEEEVYKSEAERSAAIEAALAKAGAGRKAIELVEAQAFLRGGKLDEALALYRKHASDSGIDGLLAREGVGIALEAQAMAATDPAQRQKLLEDALAAFRAMQPDEKGARRDYALYHEGRLLEALGKPTEAIAALKLAIATVPDTTLEPVIKTRLSALGGGS
jgi:tetratricopeptide (TPR) repeat protein